MIKDIEATAKEIIEKNLPYPPIDRDGDEVEVKWDTCRDQLHEKLNDSVGAPVDGHVDRIHVQLARVYVESVKQSPWFEKTWEDYVSDYCTDSRYRTEMFNEAKRLP